MVAKAFKNTEIGVIPEDWELNTIGSIVKYIKGYPFKSKDYCTDGVRVIRISDTTYNSIKESGGIYVSDRTAKETIKWALSTGDLIVSTVGSKPPMYDSMVGKVIYVKEKFAGSLLNQNAVMFKNENDSLQILLSNIFNTKRYVQYIEQIFRGNANQASITLDELFKFQIALPPHHSEQKAIAEALSHADAWIANLEQLIAKKRLIKQGAMQQLLSPKEDWVVKKLGEIGKIFGGLSGKTKADFGSGTAYYIPFMNVMKNVVIDKKFLERVKLKNGESQNRIYKYDLLFNGSSETPEELGISSVLLSDIENLYLNSFCFGFRIFDNEVNPLFLSYLMRSPYGRKVIFYLAQGATRYNLSKANFFNLEVSFPKSFAEQTRITTILSDMDKEIESLENKLEKARQIKQGMMQELLTGRVRLVKN